MVMSPIEITIYVFYQALWYNKYIHKHAKNCDHFFSPLYELIFCNPFPRLYVEYLEVLDENSDWYLDGT